MSDIDNYKLRIETIKNNYLRLNTELEIRDLFKGVIIMFIKDIVRLYNKLIIILPQLKFSKSSEKISNLNKLLYSLESDGKMFNLDVTDIIFRAYINYFYLKYRDDMMEWNIQKIKLLDEESIKSVLMDGAKSENIEEKASEYLNIIPEIVLMANNLKENDILKLLYLLNNINIIIDIYLLKKSQGIF